MARTTIPTQAIAYQSNAAITFNAADQPNGMKFTPDGQTVIIVKNGSGSTRTVTITDVPDSRGRRAPSAQTSISVAAGAERWIGPYPYDGWAQQSGADQGMVQLDVDSGTSVSIACVQLTRQ